MLAAGGAGPAGIARSRDTLRADAAGRAVVSQERAQIRRVRLEGIEERKRFCCLDVIHVSAKADRMAVVTEGHTVYQFESRLAIEVRIAAVHASCKGIGKFEVWLGGHRGEVK